MKKLVITEKTKILKNEIENYQKILAKYRKQKNKECTRQKELKNKMNERCGVSYDEYKKNFDEYKKLDEEYSKIDKKLTRLNFYIDTAEKYRKSWLELYAFNLLKDNKNVINQPLYYKKEQERLLEHFNFEGLRFTVYKREWLAYNQGLYMYDDNSGTCTGQELLNDEWLEDLSLIPENLRYKYHERYLSYKNFEEFTKNKYKQIIKIAKKTQKYIDIIEEEREKLGGFKYEVAELDLNYAKDWQKYGRF